MKVNIESSEFKKFLDLGVTVYVDILIREKDVVFVSANSTNIAIYKRQHSEVILQDREFRVPRSLLKKLAVDGYMNIVFTPEQKVVLEFYNDNSPVYKVKLPMQIVDSEFYKQLIDLDVTEYEEINLSALKPIVKVASIFDTTISTSDNVAFMEIKSTIFTRQVNAPNLTLSGKSLARLYKLDNLYNVNNMVAGKTNNITLFVKKMLHTTFDDYSFVEELIKSSKEEVRTNLTKVAILSKKLGLKDGTSILDLNNGNYTYTKDDIEYQVNLDLSNYMDKLVGIPDWIVRDLLVVYPDLLSNILIRIIGTRVLIESPEFKILFRNTKN